MQVVNQTQETQEVTNYDIISYKINVVDKKLLHRESKWENLLHMTAGHTSEISDELFTALQKQDSNELIAEIGDATFFLVGQLIFMDLWKESNFPKIIATDNMLMNLGFDWHEEKGEDFDGQKYLTIIVNTLQAQNGKICTVVKNLMIKDKAMLEGVVLNEEQILHLYTAQLITLNTLAYFMGFGWHKVREANAVKLGLRYKESFTAEESVNRNVAVENQAIAETVQAEEVK